MWVCRGQGLGRPPESEASTWRSNSPTPTDYDDGTKWEVDGGVLKLGREDGEWSVFVSPGHWATIEVAKDTKEKKHDKDEKDDKDDDKDEDDDN
jgi:hypothetical protein